MSVSAPSAPGRLGTPVEASAALSYLDALGAWRDGRRVELDELDAAALQARPEIGRNPAVTADIALSMALWKAAADRYEQLLRVWDSGRVGPQERERLSSLIWGRLDNTMDAGLVARSSAPGRVALAVSLPEACRLSDALASQLRVRLGLELSGAETTARIRTLRAQLERIRDQVGLEPAGSRQRDAAVRQSELARRLADLAAKADRGGDVGGMLGPLEIEAATYERDLIVGAAQRREARIELDRARRLRAELESRTRRLQELATEIVASVDPAPKFAVPDVGALGPVPNTPEAIALYLGRLARVERAITTAETAYGEAGQRRSDLLAQLDATRVRAEASGAAEAPDVARAYAMALETLERRPAPLLIAEQLVRLHQTYVASSSTRSPGPPASRPTSEAS